MAGAAPPQATAEQDVVVVIRFPTAATLEAWRAPAAASRVGYGEWGASLEFARCIYTLYGAAFALWLPAW